MDNQNYNSERRRYVPDDIIEETKDGNFEKKNDFSPKDWAKNNKMATFFIAIATILLIMALWRFSALFITILTNIWLYVVLAGVGLAAMFFYMGRVSYKTKLKSKDKLNIDLDTMALSFEGELDDTPNGKVFYPVISESIFSENYLQIKDVSSKLSLVDGVNKSPEDRMGIYIPSDVSKRVDKTAYGKELLALGSELKPVASGGNPRIQLKRPDTVGEDSYNKLRQEYTKLEREYDALESELETAEVESKRAIKRARKKEEDIVNRKHKEMVELLESLSIRSQNQDNSDSIQIGGTDD